MVERNPLVASGAKVAEFSGAVTRRKKRATVMAGSERVTLNARGARLVGELLAASPEKVRVVEELLAQSAAAPGADMISPNEAASLLGVSRPTVLRWSDEGLLTDHLVGTHHRFSRAEVLELHRSRIEQASQARHRAAKERQALVDQGVDLDVPPTPAELVVAGVAARSGDRTAAAGVLARQRRQAARAAAAAAGESTDS